MWNKPTMQIPLSPLTDREQEILRLLAKGLSDKEIAESTFMTVGTVKWYNRQIYSKLDVGNRTEAVTHAQTLRLLDDDTPIAPMPQSELKPHLPAQITSFVGRHQELKTLKNLLNTARLVTLTGPPGAGKTRLALEVAAGVTDRYRDGVYFVALAPIADPTLIWQTIAHVLEMKETGHDSLSNELKRFLREKKLLLVLDNFEHLLPAAPLVSELLSVAPHLNIIVTSRALLRLYGEQEFSVPPLQLPDLKQETSLERIRSSEALELFVQRSKAAAPTFTMDDANITAIASICVHLDGLPLAIELAAARIKFYAPQTLLIRLGNRLEALSDGPRDFPSRQRTLRATLAWSYDLLTREEQILFARLGVFAGGFTFDDAQAVCSEGLNLDIADGLESLINNSLISQVQSLIGEPRFMLLETMREYALEKLDECGEKAVLCEQHAQHFLSLTEQATQAYYGSQAKIWFLLLEAEHDNMRSALRWCITSENGQMGLRFIGGLATFWKIRSHMSEGRAWLPQILVLKGADESTKVRADALHGIAELAYLQSDYDTTRTFSIEALAIYQKLGLQRQEARIWVVLGEVATEVGDYVGASPLFQKGYAISRQVGDVNGSANALTQLGWSALRRTGDYDQARECLEEGCRLFETVGDHVNTALAYSGLGEIAVRIGELEKATILLEKSLKMRRELSQTWGIAASLGSLAWVALLQQDYEHAIQILRESLQLRSEISDRGGMAWCLEKLAEIAQLKGDPRRAVKIFGAAAAIRASVSSIIDPSDQPHYQNLIAVLRSELTDNLFESIWSEGYAMTLDEIVQQFVQLK
jgi:predicted ATPase/DNA-binding CsgD family transcriptional regulator